MSDQQDPPPHHYDLLTPDTILDAVESIGLKCDGRLLALNSYENRVYQVGIEDEQPVIAKFYRPERWSNQAILEEHNFTLALAEIEIPVVPPIVHSDGNSLHQHADFEFALYERRGGRWPELDNSDNLMWMGRFIARIHALGAVKPFEFRPTVDIESYGTESVRYLHEQDFIPQELRTPYFSLAEDVLKQVEQKFELAGDVKHIRLHGDNHPGNILWTDSGPHFVDFDDARMGPAVQDLWMLLSGERRQMTEQFGDLMEGYTEFADFNPMELHLIEALRTLRMIHYSAWLARRWEDPTFPINFPWFAAARYWEEQILALREQAALMQEEPIFWQG